MESKIVGQGLAPAVKKLLSLLLAIVMLIGITAGIDLSAYAATSGDYEYLVSILNNENANISKYNGSATSITIPSKIDGYTVTGIADRAFSECANLKSVVIPSGVKSIGNYAFNKCSSLTSVSIPNTVTSIGTNAFSYCESLTRITLPDSITNISAFLFQYCEKLNNVTIPNTVTRIGASAFLSCKSLATVTIPESVTSIGSAAFSRCENLKSITIPKSITNIEAYAFENSLILPDSVVYFNGTIKEWNALYTACNTYGNNDSLFNCIVYCSDGIADCKHEFDNGAITKAATCTERGVKTYTCTACGVIKNESIPANGHTTVTIEGVDPTCTEPGKTSGLYCSVCNKVILPQTTLPAAHSYDDGVVTKAATCAETGIKTYSCINCNETKTETIPRKGHTAVADEAVAPTCTKTGLTKGYHCSVCNAVITAQKTVSATGHSYDNGKVTKAATCTKKGTKTYTCTVCKATKTETISAKGHSYDSGKVTKAATCSATGVKTYTCTVCKVTKTETIKVIAHKAVTDNAVDTTCTKAGKTAGSHCSVCNATITAQEIVPAKGHNYKTTTTKATTKKNGSIVKKCSNCGVSTKTTIYYPKTITLSKTSYVYNGKAQKPSVTVKDSKGKKITTSNYTVKYTSNKNVGKATVTITFKGNYKGTVKKTFTIKPKATTLSSVTAKSKGFTAKWKKQATQTTGYQIQYSTDKNFKKNNKTVTVSKNKTTSKAVSKLKAKKKYYVRIRTYKTVKVNGKSTKIYSAWSKSKSVKTK